MNNAGLVNIIEVDTNLNKIYLKFQLYFTFKSELAAFKVIK